MRKRYFKRMMGAAVCAAMVIETAVPSAVASEEEYISATCEADGGVADGSTVYDADGSVADGSTVYDADGGAGDGYAVYEAVFDESSEEVSGAAGETAAADVDETPEESDESAVFAGGAEDYDGFTVSADGTGGISGQKFLGRIPASIAPEHHPVPMSEDAHTGGVEYQSYYISPYFVTGIKDQGYTNACWAFASASAIEAGLNKKYGGDHRISWKSMAYWAYHVSDIQKDDPMYGSDTDDYIKYSYNANTFQSGYKNTTDENGGDGSNYVYLGGNEYYTMFLHAQNRAIKDDIGDDSMNISLRSYSSIGSKAGQIGSSISDKYRIRDNWLISGDSGNVGTIKKMIADHGAGVMSYYSGDETENKSTGAAFNDPEDPLIKEKIVSSTDENGVTGDFSNHSVTVIGWDDDYSASNFSTVPQADGAWICANSWGEGSEFTLNGYTYISYYDASIKYTNVCFVDVYDKGEVSEEEKKDLWFDINYGANGDKTGKAVYDANTMGISYTADTDSTLKAVSFFSFEDNAEYSLGVYGDPVIDETGAVDLNNSTLLSSQHVELPYAGTHQIDLDKAVGISAGQSVVLIMKPKSTVRKAVSPIIKHVGSNPTCANGLYYGHQNVVSMVSGEYMTSIGDDRLAVDDSYDYYLRVLLNNGIEDGAETFAGADYSLARVVTKSAFKGASTDDSGSTGNSDMIEDLADKTFKVTCETPTVVYTAKNHGATTDKKKSSTNDVKVKVTSGGKTVDPLLYKVKFKNSKNATGVGKKEPMFYVVLGKGADKEEKKRLKKTPYSFNIRKADISEGSSDVTFGKVNMLIYPDGTIAKLKVNAYDKDGRKMRLRIDKTGGNGGDVKVKTYKTSSNTYQLALIGHGNLTGTRVITLQKR